MLRSSEVKGWTVSGPLKKDDTGGEESGKEDKAVKKGAVGKGKDDSDG